MRTSSLFASSLGTPHFSSSPRLCMPTTPPIDQQPSQPMSPYASMQIPFFDRLESAEHSLLNHRDYEVASSAPSAGLVVAQRERDKAFMEKATGRTGNPGADGLKT
ncbi:hypothetical protein JCM8547_006123 [Rhodosporidiobolus lusitaniae]